MKYMSNGQNYQHNENDVVVKKNLLKSWPSRAICIFQCVVVTIRQ